VASTYCDTPVGSLLIVASEVGITTVRFPNRSGRRLADPGRKPGASGATELLQLTCTQLTEYFAGSRTTFDVPLDPEGTNFERRVWDMLREIPYGATTSYGVLAKRLGDITLSRAVGAANGANPIPIIVPCHRVIGSNGDLTGFGGGLDRKRWLLEHEGALMKLGS
jgi:methylated-DNA-[protein]-cysteine S-methyltransferase